MGLDVGTRFLEQCGKKPCFGLRLRHKIDMSKTDCNFVLRGKRSFNVGMNIKHQQKLEISMLAVN
jgi:hypothetical protein